MSDMSTWKTLDQIRADLDHTETTCDGMVAAGRTVVYRTDPDIPCADCGGGYREDPADPKTYIPHLTTLCPAIS